jgi:hypothetical protein
LVEWKKYRKTTTLALERANLKYICTEIHWENEYFFIHFKNNTRETFSNSHSPCVCVKNLPPHLSHSHEIRRHTASLEFLISYFTSFATCAKNFSLLMYIGENMMIIIDDDDLSIKLKISNSLSFGFIYRIHSSLVNLI